MIQSFWSRMQVELLDRQRWRTRIELERDLRLPRDLAQPTPPAQRPPPAHPRGVQAPAQRGPGLRVQPHRLHETGDRAARPPDPGL